MWSVLIFSLLKGIFYDFQLNLFFLVFISVILLLKKGNIFKRVLGKFWEIDKIKNFLFFLSLVVVFFIFILKPRKELILLVTTLFVFFFTKKIVLFYIFFEFSIIPAFFLVYKIGKNPERLQALSYLIVYTVLGSFPLIYSILSCLNLFERMTNLFLLSTNSELSSKVTSIFSFFFVFAFFIKLPLFGVHKWLPKAHVEAPTSGSMILAALLLKMGRYGLYRIRFSVKKVFFRKILIGWVLFSLVLVRFICFRIFDLKMLIAYSSVNHMILVAYSWVLLRYRNMYFSLLLRIRHGFIRRALFLLVGTMYENSNSRRIFFKKGIKKIFSLLNFFWFGFLMLNCSAPTSLSLFSEVYIFSHLASKRFSVLRIGCFVFFSGLYCIYLYTLSFHGATDQNFSFFKKTLSLKLRRSLHFFYRILAVFFIIFLI